MGWVTGDVSILWVPIYELMLLPIFTLKPAAFHFFSLLVALNFLLSCSFILLPTPFLYLLFLIYHSHSLFMTFLITYFSPCCYLFSYFLFCKLTSSQIDRQSKTSDRGGKMLGGEDKVLFVCMCIHCVLRWGKDEEGIQYNMFPV